MASGKVMCAYIADTATTTRDHNGFTGEGEMWEGGSDCWVGLIVPFGGKGGEGGLHFGGELVWLNGCLWMQWWMLLSWGWFVNGGLSFDGCGMGGLRK